MRWLTALPLLILVLVALVVVSACTTLGGETSPEAETKPPETPLETAQRFLDLWQEQEHGKMYDLVSAEARASISKEDFVKRYNDIADEATITGILVARHFRRREQDEQVDEYASDTFHSLLALILTLARASVNLPACISRTQRRLCRGKQAHPGRGHIVLLVK